MGQTPEQAKVEQEQKAERQKQQTEAAEKFKTWALKNTAVTDISINGPTMFVTLKSEKYTNRDNVRVIAEQLARYYALQSGETYVACHVYFGQKEYAKGVYAK